MIVGFGWRVFFINVQTHGCVVLDLPCYFQSFRAEAHYLLVIFGTGILRLDDRGTILWENDGLAVDGIAIENIDGDAINGMGECDPPGGWRPFSISLATGRSATFFSTSDS